MAPSVKRWYDDLIEVFGDTAPYTDEDGKEHYQTDSDPEEKYRLTKLENLAKQGHGIPFSPSVQTALNVGKTVIRT